MVVVVGVMITRFTISSGDWFSGVFKEKNIDKRITADTIDEKS